jgi:L-arabinokinase
MKDFFQVERPVFEASAPGRLDVMGGVADYSGSLVLQMPIEEETTVRIQLTEEDFFTVVSEVDGGQKSASIAVNEILRWGEFGRVDTSTGLHLDFQKSQNFWARYILGCFLLASQTFDFQLSGARIYVTSDVPIGAGLSSSAALEVATLRVLAKAYNLTFDPLQLPKLAQRVENEIVGAACGLMDQLASHHGVPGELLPISCQPAKLHGTILLPEDLVLERVSSGVMHSVSGEAYTTARTAAYMGYGLLAAQAGATKEQLLQARDMGDWSKLPYGGYLANFDAKHFEESLESTLPETMLGADFLSSGAVSIDLVTKIDPAQEYPVRAAASHPVYENACIRQFASLLAQIDNIDLPRHQVFARLGLLMLSSHASYSAIGLGHAATDEIVHKVVAKGAKRGYYGARITGGGCGGTVVVLRRR